MPKVKLTGAILDRLKAPKSGQIDYFDAGYPGLALRVSSKGTRTWVYFGRLDGKVKRVTLGRLSELDRLARARKKAGEVAERLRDGQDPTAARRARRDALLRDTVENVIHEWIRRDQAGNRSVGAVERIMRRDVLPIWATQPITKIKRRDILDLIDRVADRGAVIQARRVHAYLHRLFRWSVARGIIESNPMAGLPKPGRERARDRVLSDEELSRVWRAAENMPYPFGPAVRLLILTGARRDEITALRWAEVNGDAIELAGERTKTGAAHTIPLCDEARAILEGLPRISHPETREAEHVFTTTGRTPVSGWSKAKTRLDEEAAGIDAAGAALTEPSPLPPWRLHDLRRTLATGLQRLGHRLEVIESVLGHVGGSRAGIVKVYQTYRFDAEKRQALDDWAAHIARLLETRPLQRAG